MAINVNENTELNIPIKTLIAIIAGLLSASWYVFGTQSKLHELETEIKLLKHDLETYKNQPGRNHVDIEIMKRDIEFLKQRK